MADLKKWIRIPGAGEQRGEGSWQEVSGELMETDYLKCKQSGYLPTARQIGTEEIVKDRQGKAPNYIMRGDEMVHQFHEIATPVKMGDPEVARYAQRQLMHLLKTVLVIEGEVSDG